MFAPSLPRHPGPAPSLGSPPVPPEHGGEGRGARGGRRAGGNKAPGKQQQQPQPHWRGSGCPFVKQRQQEMRQSRLKRRIGWGEGIKKKMKKGGKNRPLWTEHKIPVMRRQWQPPRFGDLRTRTAWSHCPSPSWQENNHQNPTFSFLFIFFSLLFTPFPAVLDELPGTHGHNPPWDAPTQEPEP